ncbi:MAG: glycosyltransferase family 39 protein [Chloroflexi bacterium]|nr:glycosyltransferase family 39 protein [Chloroflexota bacterium]
MSIAESSPETNSRRPVQARFYRSLPRTLGWLAAVLLGLAWLVQPALDGHGLQATYAAETGRVDRTAFITANDSVYTGQPLSITWSGYLYQPADEVLTLRLPTSAAARLLIDGQPIFEREITDRAADESVTARLSAGFHRVHFAVTTPTQSREYFRAGLEWATPLGWRLIPAAYLYPQPIDHDAALQVHQRRQWSLWLSGGAALTGLLAGLFALIGQHHRLKQHAGATLRLALIVALAFIVRLTIFDDLVTRPNYDRLPVGHDQRTYQGEAQEMLRGHYPGGPFSIQPGMSLLLGAVYDLGGLELRLLPALQTVAGALATLLLFDIARQTFSRAAGWLAALLWVFFPLAIFYEAQLVTHGLEVSLSAWLIWLWLRAVETPRMTRLIPLGLTIGAASIIRPTLLPTAGLVVLSLIGWRITAWRTAVKPALILAVACLLPIAPITWHNYQTGGQFQLINGHTDITLYMGNNRDANGLALTSPATWATATLVRAGQTTYGRQTVDDIRANPARWLQLMIRKMALYLGDAELPNNVDFQREGTAVSPWLAALPMHFGLALMLALAGVLMHLRRDAPRSAGLWVLSSFIVVQFLANIVHSSFSRLRAPTYAALMALAAGALLILLQQISRRQWRLLTDSCIRLALSGAFVLSMPWVADRIVSPPVVVAVPAGVRHLNAPVRQGVRLVGYDYEPLPTRPGDQLVMTFYWQSEQPIEPDLHLTLELLDAAGYPIGDQRFLGFIGTGSYPEYQTSHWRPGEIVRDPFAMTLPDDAHPAMVRVFVAAPNEDRYAAVGPLPLVAPRPLARPIEAVPLNVTVGTAQLAGYRLTSTADALSLTLFWLAHAPSVDDGIVFIHLYDQHGRLIGGQDQRPANDLSSTQAWQPDEGIIDEHRLAWPPELHTAGTPYRIGVGVYDAQTQQRWPMTDANGAPIPDNELILFEGQR